MSNEVTKDNKNAKATASKPGWVRWSLTKIIIIILLFFNVIALIANSQYIQEKVVRVLGKYIYDKTGYNSQMSTIRLDINRGLTFQDFLIKDLHGDTLIYAGKFNSDLLGNLIPMIVTKDFKLSEFLLQDSKLNIVKKEGDSLSNIEDFIKRLGSSDSKGCNKIQVDKIVLKNTLITNRQFDRKTDEKLYFAKLDLDIDKIDVCNNEFRVKYLRLEEPIIEVVTKRNVSASNKKSKSNKTGSTSKLNVFVEKLLVDDGVFSLVDKVNCVSKSFDYPHFDICDMKLSSIDADLVNVALNSEGTLFSSKINNIGFNEKHGFRLKYLKTDLVEVDSSELSLDNLVFSTNNSSVASDVTLKYGGFQDFADFTDKVRFNIDFAKSYLRAKDLLFFIPNQRKTSVLVTNKYKKITVAGKLSGTINDFSSSRVRVNVDNNLDFDAALVLRNLANSSNDFLSLKDFSLSTDVEFIKSFFSNVNFGNKFSKFGKIDLKGDFVGDKIAFKSKGLISSDIGSAQVDIDVKKDTSDYKYTGELVLNKFDIGKFSDLKEVGTISGKVDLIEGRGVDFDHLEADVNAKLDSFDFMQYTYKNANFSGNLLSRKFNGTLIVKDDNIDLSLNGLVDLRDSIPVFDLEAEFFNTDLTALNLYKTPLVVSGKTDVDFIGVNLDDFSGSLSLEDITLKNDSLEVNLEHLNINSSNNDDGERYFDIDSELLYLYFDGKYNVRNIKHAILNILDRNFSKFLKGIDKNVRFEEEYPNFYYDFRLEIEDSKDLFSVLTNRNIKIENLLFSGFADHAVDSLRLDFKIDSFAIDNKSVKDFNAAFNLYQGYGDLELKSKIVNINGTDIHDFSFNSDVDKDELYFQFSVDSIGRVIDDIAFSGRTIPLIDSFGVEVFGGYVKTATNDLDFTGRNKIVIGKNYINLTDFSLKEEGGMLSFSDINDNKGVRIDLQNLNIDIVDFLIKYSRLSFSGFAFGNIEIPNIFKTDYLLCDLIIPDLFINDDHFGKFNVQAYIDPDDEKKIKFNSNMLVEQKEIMNTKGYYNLRNKMFYGDFSVDEFPLDFLEYIIGEDGIEDTKGVLTANMKVLGGKKDINISGNGIVENGETKVSYTGVKYYFDNQKFTLNNNGIDMTGVVIKDKYGNKADVVGGITYDRFDDWGVDVSMSSDKMLILETNKTLNPDYWGTAIGKADAKFTGLFDEVIKMDIDAVTASMSTLTIPVRYNVDPKKSSFINFSDPDIESSKKADKKKKKGLGIDLDLYVDITEDAEVKIIMSEKEGDNLYGKGTGGVRLLVKEDGAIEMYGDYEFVEGKYLFTFRTVVNKIFSIRKEGTISWSGDPFGAILDIKADYNARRIPLNTLLAEYENLIDNNTIYKSDVDLILLLTGTLLNPNIGFDFQFKNVDSQVKTIVANKLQNMRSSPNTLNNQAWSIMILGSFIPDENLLGTVGNAGYLQSGGINTINEFLSSQFSGYMTDLLSEILDSSQVISGVDFSVNSRNSSLFSNIPNSESGVLAQYYDFATTLWLWDNKVKVEFGGDYTGDSNFSARKNFVSGGNVKIETFLTKDKRLKVRLFFIREYDEIDNDWENKSGIGLEYGKDFHRIYKKKE